MKKDSKDHPDGRNEPLPVDQDAPRYAPGRKLPDRRYLPGLGPHPHDLAGAPPPEAAPEVPCERFGETELFRHGVDLYNRAYFWEAHEAWETLWAACPQGSPERDALQGLIQLSAALLKEHLGVTEGAKKLSRTACEKLERARAKGARLPVDLEDLVARSKRHFARLSSPDAPHAPRPPIRLA
ncbi:DUF309 domain-containing protein [bacterium]|nr:DUF309 domain-containing protein [bacterium]